MSSCDVQYMDEQLAAILAEEADSNYTKVSANEAIRPDDDVIEEKPDQAVTTQNEVDSNNVTVNQDEETAETTTDESLATSNSDPGENSTISDSDDGWAGADPAEADSTEKHEVPNLRPKAEDNMTKKVSTAGWEKPEPLEKIEENPFPVQALPEPYRSFCKALAKEKAVPLGMPGLGILGAISVALNGKYIVDAGRGGWKEQTNLYVLVSDKTGARKSQVLKALMEPITEYRRSWNAEHKVDIRLSKEQKERLEDKAKQLKAAFDKGKCSYDDYVRATKEAEEFEPTRAIELYVDNSTAEALAQTMEDHKERISLVSSEGGMFDVISQAYASNGAVNMNILNKSYDGEAYTDCRVTRKNVHLERPILTMMLFIQDGKLEEVLQNKSWIENGFFNRWCFAKISETTAQDADSDTTAQDDDDDDGLKPNMDERIRQEYFRAIKSLLRDESYQRVICLEPDAANLFYGYFKAINKRTKNPDDPLSNEDGWGRKQAGRVLRIAGLLARANLSQISDFSAPVINISAQVMNWAIQIGDYLTREYVGAIDAWYHQSGNQFIKEDVEKALDIIAQEGWKEFKPTDLQKKAYRFRKREVREGVISMLESKGYIRKLRKNSNGIGWMYETNPYHLAQKDKPEGH